MYYKIMLYICKVIQTTNKMNTKYNFWLNFKVEGSNRERMCTTIAVSERSAKAHVKLRFGKSVKVKFIEIVNNGIAK